MPIVAKSKEDKTGFSDPAESSKEGSGSSDDDDPIFI
jgi:hypothetical protein